MDPLEIRMLHRRIDLLEQIVEQAGLADHVRFRPNADPAPDDPVRGGFGPIVGGRIRVPIPRPGDPAPFDISRLNKVQLQAALHDLAAERTRLESMESLLREQMELGGP